MMYLQTGGFIACFSKCVQYNECITERKEAIIKKVYSLAALREHPIINRINAFLATPYYIVVIMLLTATIGTIEWE